MRSLDGAPRASKVLHISVITEISRPSGAQRVVKTTNLSIYVLLDVDG
jgi:hypothetical protein